jgi:hypothetical protein
MENQDAVNGGIGIDAPDEGQPFRRIRVSPEGKTAYRNARRSGLFQDIPFVGNIIIPAAKPDDCQTRNNALFPESLRPAPRLFQNRGGCRSAPEKERHQNAPPVSAGSRKNPAWNPLPDKTMFTPLRDLFDNLYRVFFP